MRPGRREDGSLTDRVSFTRTSIGLRRRHSVPAYCGEIHPETMGLARRLHAIYLAGDIELMAEIRAGELRRHGVINIERACRVVAAEAEGRLMPVAGGVH